MFTLSRSPGWRWRSGRMAVVSLLLALVGVWLPVMAAEPPTTIVIVDGSGSMWGKLDGERLAKLYMVRDGLRAGFAKMSPQSRVGLASFGHRRAGDCGDAEVIVKPEALSLDRLMPPIEKLNPRGRGPITAALREVAKDLGSPASPATVILIHDDVDNCQQDPCSTIGDLRRAHPGVTVHAISLGLRKDDAQKLACLPKGTGGRHYEVATQAQLNAALDEALSLAGAAPSQPAAAPDVPQEAARPAAPAVPAEAPGVLLSATLAAGGEPIETPIRWRISKAGDTSGTLVWEGDEAHPLVTLPSGRYDVEAWLGFVRARSTVEAVEGQRRTLIVPLNAGTLRFGQTTPRSQAIMRDAVISFRRLDGGPSETLALQRGVEPEMALVAGSYLVSVSVGGFRADRGVTLRPGDRLPFQPSLNFGEIALTAVGSPGGPALEDAEFTIYEDDPDAPQGRREIARSAALTPRFALPPGTYYAVARIGATEGRERVTVKPGETETRALLVEAARLTITARLAGNRGDITEPVTHRLERIGGERQDALLANRPTSTLQVAAGRYRLETRIGTGNARAEREIEVKAGARDQISVEIPAGMLVLHLVDSAGGPPLADVAWDVRDMQGRTVWLGNQTEGRPLLLAGRYTVTGSVRNRRTDRVVEVRASEIRTYDLTAQ